MSNSNNRAIMGKVSNESKQNTVMLNTRQSFHDELAALEQELLHMGTLTGTMLSQAVEAVQQGDVAPSRIFNAPLPQTLHPA